MSLAFLLLQNYDFHSSYSSYKNAMMCMNYAEGLHSSAFFIISVGNYILVCSILQKVTLVSWKLSLSRNFSQQSTSSQGFI